MRALSSKIWRVPFVQATARQRKTPHPQHTDQFSSPQAIHQYDFPSPPTDCLLQMQTEEMNTPMATPPVPPSADQSNRFIILANLSRTKLRHFRAELDGPP